MSISPPPTKSKPPVLPIQRMAMVGGEVAVVTLVIVLGAVFGGIWLDRVFHTGWILTILLVILSAPLSITITFWLAMRAVRDLNSPSQARGISGATSAQTKIQDEEGGNDW